MIRIAALCVHGQELLVKHSTGLSNTQLQLHVSVRNKPFSGCKLLYKKYNYTCNGKHKRKVHPITGHEGPDLEYMYKSTLSLTSAIDGVGGGRITPGKTRYPLQLYINITKQLNLNFVTIVTFQSN